MALGGGGLGKGPGPLGEPEEPPLVSEPLRMGARRLRGGWGAGGGEEGAVDLLMLVISGINIASSVFEVNLKALKVQ